MEAPARWWSFTGETAMVLVTPAKAPAMTGQLRSKAALGRVRGMNSPAFGAMILAPVERAASARPVISKQLSGLLMGLSVTTTLAAPALKHSVAIAASRSGCVVAPRDAGLAKAAFTLMSTTSPFWMKISNPPSAATPRSNMAALSEPRMMASLPGCPTREGAVKSPRPVSTLPGSTAGGAAPS